MAARKKAPETGAMKATNGNSRARVPTGAEAARKAAAAKKARQAKALKLMGENMAEARRDARAAARKKTAKKKVTKKTAGRGEVCVKSGYGTEKTQRILNEAPKLMAKVAKLEGELKAVKAAKKTTKKTSKKSPARKTTARKTAAKKAPAKRVMRSGLVKTDRLSNKKLDAILKPAKSTTVAKGRRVKVMKTWVCSGPVRTGCGGGKTGGHVLGNLTDHRAVRIR